MSGASDNRPKAKAQSYRRRRPEQTVLYSTVQKHWETFRQRAEATGALRGFVVNEFEQYLRCGILAHGALRSDRMRLA